jgi:KDO2-lipid IV(A) lauroyltransferase
MPDPAASAPAPTVAAEARAPRTPTLAHRLEFAALRGAIGGLGRLPWKQATAVGAWLGRIGYAPAGVRRGVVERQIAAAFPEFTAQRVREVARASYESLGRTTIEAALMPRLGARGVLDLFERVEGWELLEAARARGRGAIIVTGHLGNWELGGSYVAARGIPIDGIARQQANPLFDDFLTGTRERLGMDVVWDGHAVRRTPRSLRENRVVAMVSDQGALGLASTYVPFFGRPAKTPRGPAVFALRLDVPILFAVSVRLPNGRFRLVFEPVEVAHTGDRDRDVDTIVATYTQALERWVRAYPEQYFWQHRRWKHQPPDTPPHLREP